MKAYRMLEQTEAATKKQKKFRLPYCVLFGKGLNGDFAKVASGKIGGREAKGGEE
jgi:hypothetical protein